MAGRVSREASASEARVRRWRFPFLAFSVGIVSLWASGFLGAALAFGVAAALAWKTGRSSALRWALTTLAVLCLVGLVVMALDAGFGTGTVVNRSAEARNVAVLAPDPDH